MNVIFADFRGARGSLRVLHLNHSEKTQDLALSRCVYRGRAYGESPRLTTADVRPRAAKAAPRVAAAEGETIDPKVLRLALQATTCATQQGVVERPATLTVIDYSRPSTKPRLWVLDLATGKVLFEELVAHGQGSGADLATKFSDEPDSHQSSLGRSSPRRPTPANMAIRCASRDSRTG